MSAVWHDYLDRPPKSRRFVRGGPTKPGYYVVAFDGEHLGGYFDGEFFQETTLTVTAERCRPEGYDPPGRLLARWYEWPEGAP